MVIGKKIGSGTFGNVFDLTIPGEPKPQFVVKFIKNDQNQDKKLEKQHFSVNLIYSFDYAQANATRLLNYQRSQPKNLTKSTPLHSRKMKTN